jgi:integrase
MPPHHTKTASGTRAHIRIHGVLYRRHFPTGTDPLIIKQWLLATETRYRGSRARRSGRFEDDAQVYLEAVKAMPSYADRALHIKEWITVFGSQWRHTITAEQIRAQLAIWRTTSRTVTITRRATDKLPVLKTLALSPSSVNKRRTALMHLFTVLDGKAAPNPVRDVPKYREPDALPRGLPYDAIRQLWAVMGDTATRARLQIMAYIGLPHAQIAALSANDVDWQGGTVLVSGRRKGAGTGARLVPLTADGLKALKAMRRTDAWGSFSRSSVRRDFRAACAKVPALAGRDLTPYDLRHSFGTEVYRVSGDIRSTQVLMGHSSPTLTHRYTLGAVDGRIRVSLEGFGKKR